MTDEKLHILVADDEAVIRDGLKQIISKENHEVTLTEDGMDAFEHFQRFNHFQIAFIDLKMPRMNGLELLKEIKKISPSTEVVIITAYGTVENAVKAMKAGAYDYISKPFAPKSIRQIIHKIIEKRHLLNEPSSGNIVLEYGEMGEKIIGAGKRMQEIYELIHKVAPTDSTVLITGETGTGKELIARAIHHNSLRREKPFLTVDCSSLVETLFESELFGHVKGSFTGAVATKHGTFELANGGTFFFDEIGNISLNIQAKILRAIQEKEIKRVGATETIKVDVRVIAATNKDLRRAVEDGTFREDLYYRISVIPIHLPPLHERKEDINAIANYFLEKYNKKRKRNIQQISPDVQQLLLNYNWPGNVRELENVIERAVVIEDTDEITLSSLPTHIQGKSANTGGEHFEIRSLNQMEKAHIQKTLEATQWNRSKTAKLLGIDRKTLYEKIKKYGITQES